MNLPGDTSSGKLTYLGHDSFEVTMSILMSDPTTQSRGCQKKKKERERENFKIIMLAQKLCLNKIPCKYRINKPF